MILLVNGRTSWESLRYFGPNDKGQQNSWPKVDEMTRVIPFYMLFFFILSAAILSDMTCTSPLSA
jgi:hypothetical protein